MAYLRSHPPSHRYDIVSLRALHIAPPLTLFTFFPKTAAGFGAIATIFGLLAHIREFAVTGFSTCFASIGAGIALIAFGFDLALFIIAKKRIESASVGGTATLGNALWMTLAGTLLLMCSGCFFGVCPHSHFLQVYPQADYRWAN